VPVAASGLADRLVRHARKWVGGRVEQHLLAGTARLFLRAAALVEGLARSRGVSGEGVARLLELSEAEQRRSPAARAGGAHWDCCGPGREHQPRQLVLQARDLVAQRAADGRLVDEGRAKGVRLHRRGHVSPRSVRSG
jgi:hypothetical protein